MKSKHEVVVSVLTLAVAVLCLIRDESIWSFVKRVGGAYLFFSLVGSFLSALWRLSTPKPGPEPDPKPVNATDKADPAHDANQAEAPAATIPTPAEVV